MRIGMKKKDKRLKKSGLTKEQLEHIDKMMIISLNKRMGYGVYDPNFHYMFFSDLKDDKKDGNSYIYGE